MTKEQFKLEIEQLRITLANERARAITLEHKCDELLARSAQSSREPWKTPDYERKRDAIWRRCHMKAVAKGYDHIEFAIDAAPRCSPEVKS